MKKPIVLTTGGTGGHIFPALAVAEALRRILPDHPLHFVGGGYGPERKLAEAAGLTFHATASAGVLGRGARALAGGLKLLAGVFQAGALLRRLKPAAVVGFGGYASFPAAWAATMLGVPLAIHEQNSVPGAANRLLGRRAKRVFLAFPDKRSDFDPRRTVVTGNPVREAIAAVVPKETPGANLLVLGGSQGAKALNSAVAAMAPMLTAAGVVIRHQTGKADFDRIDNAYAQLQDETVGAVQASPFIEDMAEAYAWADLALCRSGASTVFELAASGTPAVLVPFPYATHDHQRSNAAYLADAGAGRIVLERDLDPTRLGPELAALCNDPDALRAMAGAARAQAMPRAAQTIAEGVASLAY